MTTTLQNPVTVTRRIAAPAEQIFAILADPAQHPLLDGTGMLRPGVETRVISRTGDVFHVAMHNDEMGDYEMANHVVIFEPGRRIAWEPVLSKATRPEDIEGLGDPAHHLWGYELVPVDAGSTDVTEFFDCSRSPDWLRTVLDEGKRWRQAMEVSLEKLDRLSTGV